MKAVIYARYSSDKQTEQSINGQVRVCKEYAERNNITVVGGYYDRATSGTNDNRPEFQKMIAEANNKGFDIILVYPLDRFARNQYDQVVHEHNLEKLGIRVVSATEAISNTMEGKILKSLIVSMNEMYSAELSQKVIRGNRENLLKGLWKGGNILYGYKAVDKKIVIDDEKAEIVKFIFTEYANGKSKKKIINELNAKGIKNYSGKSWTINSLQENLKNEKYLGIFKWHDEIFTNIYPPMIDKALFNRVKFMLNKRKHAPATEKAKVDYLLTGKAFCGYCGDNMVGVSGTSHTKDKYFYYTCSTRYKTKQCNKGNSKKDETENEVIRQTIEYILEPKRAEQIADLLLKQYEKDINQITIQDYEKRIINIDNEIISICI